MYYFLLVGFSKKKIKTASSRIYRIRVYRKLKIVENYQVTGKPPYPLIYKCKIGLKGHIFSQNMSFYLRIQNSQSKEEGLRSLPRITRPTCTNFGFCCQYLANISALLLILHAPMGSLLNNDVAQLEEEANDFVTTTYMQLYKRSKKLGKAIQFLKNRDVIDR